jgi:hypothetical protein
MAEKLLYLETRPLPAQGGRRSPFAKLLCPPRPTRAGAAMRFRAAIEGLERRVARLGDETLLASVRELRGRAQGYEEVTNRQAETFRRLRETEQRLRPVK